MAAALLGGAVPFFSRRSMAVESSDSRLFFFGGVGARGTESILDVSADMWCFDTIALSWREVEQRSPWPSPRRCVGLAGKNGQLLLWGGSGVVDADTASPRYNFLNDFWVFDTTTEDWSVLAESENHLLCPESSARPVPRYTPVFRNAGGRLFLFGGYTEDRLGKRKLNDAWIWGDGMWQPVAMTGKPGYRRDAGSPGLRYGCMSATDGQHVFVCGGFSDEGDHIDVWRFDIEKRTWDLLAEDVVAHRRMPAARYCAAFACHERRLFLFGGRSRRYPKRNFNDLWTFDLQSNTWILLSDNRQPHCYGAEAAFPAYHAKASSVVVGDCWYLWGGEGVSGHVSDFWRFSFPSNAWQLVQAARSDDPKFW